MPAPVARGHSCVLAILICRQRILKKQKAHEVTRDVTAWAFSVSDRFCEQSASGLGPPRSAQPDPCFATGVRQTVDRDSFRRDRSPNRVAWRFPDWTAVGFALPSPFLGSHISPSPAQSPPVTVGIWKRFLESVVGSMPRSPIDSLDAALGTTCGDVNPDCS